MTLTAGDLKKIKGVKILNEGLLRGGLRNAVIDSRICRRKDLFFAVKGERLDGHCYVEQAFQNGAICAVVNKGWYNGLSVKKRRSLNNYALVLVNDTLKALGELANVHRRKFLIPIIAVAGSNGKTSAKDYIAHVLSQKYHVLKTDGNYNNAYGVPLTLFRMRKEHDIAVVEVGTNHFGEIKYLCRIAEPQIGLITNIGKEHLEFLENIRGAAKAECELIEYLNDNFGMFFLNSDDKILIRQMRKYNVNTFTYGTKGYAHVRGRIRKFHKFNPVIEIRHMKNKIGATLKGIGSQSFNAALSAAAVGYFFQMPPGLIRKAIAEYEIESGKRNQLRNIKGVWVLDDSYNSNPDSVKSALENLKKYRINGRKYLVLADMLELGRSGKEEHEVVGKLVKKMKFENLYTYGKESFRTFMSAKGIKNNFYFEDKDVLGEFLKLNIKKGDLVLVKGSRAMKMEEVIDMISS